MTTCENCDGAFHKSELEWVRDKDHKPLKMVCVDCAELIYRRKEAEL